MLEVIHQYDAAYANQSPNRPSGPPSLKYRVSPGRSIYFPNEEQGMTGALFVHSDQLKHRGNVYFLSGEELSYFIQGGQPKGPISPSRHVPADRELKLSLYFRDILETLAIRLV